MVSQLITTESLSLYSFSSDNPSTEKGTGEFHTKLETSNTLWGPPYFLFDGQTRNSAPFVVGL